MKKHQAAQNIEPVNRSEEIGYIRKLLYSIIHNRPEFEVILNWYGIPGIGKTTLGFMTGNICKVMQIPFSRVDFDPKKNHNAKEYGKNYSLLMEDILNGFESLKPDGFSEGLEKYRKKKEPEVFVDILKHKPMVLVFDTTDKADSSFIRWLEKKIISPISNSRKCLIIWTGRTPQGWKAFEVRRRVVCQQLEPLDIEGTKQQVGEHGCRIYTLTHGHPYSNKKLAEAFNPKRNIDKNEQIMILKSQVIDNFIMKDIPSDLKEPCRILSLIRQFDVIILEQMLCAFLPDFRGTGLNLNFIGQLTSTSLIEWNKVRKGYSLNETIRYIFKRIISKTDKQRFLKITEKALNIYEEWIIQVPENRGIYILEWLYHKANIIDAKDNEKHIILKETISEFTQKIINPDLYCCLQTSYTKI